MVLVSVPPVFTVIPKDQEVTANGRIELVCAAEGIPPPVISWKVNNTARPGQSQSHLHLLLLHLIVYVGSMYDDIRLHVARSYLVHIISPFSLISSFTLSNHLLLGLPLFFSPLYLHYHHPPSYVVFLSSHHMPIPLQPPFLYNLCDFPHFRCPSYSFISDLVQLHNPAHPSSLSHLHFNLFCFVLFPIWGRRIEFSISTLSGHVPCTPVSYMSFLFDVASPQFWSSSLSVLLTFIFHALPTSSSSVFISTINTVYCIQ